MEANCWTITICTWYLRDTEKAIPFGRPIDKLVSNGADICALAIEPEIYLPWKIATSRDIIWQNGQNSSHAVEFHDRWFWKFISHLSNYLGKLINSEK